MSSEAIVVLAPSRAPAQPPPPPSWVNVNGVEPQARTFGAEIAPSPYPDPEWVREEDI